MVVLAWSLVALVVFFHLFAGTLEMFFWQSRYAARAFGLAPDFAHDSRRLAANQGLYNYFLAAGPAWALGWYGLVRGRPVLTFFLACVIVAGLFGAVTVNRRIALLQALPAALALAAVQLA